jgi:tRNA-splicing ligase RtcB (3'-phosphate/5'-hydroxy nucleic acid ligase)
MERINVNGVEIKSWLPEQDLIDNGCIAQLQHLHEIPNLVEVLIAPDAHAGAGMPIGLTLVTNGVIMPDLIGPDIGCGVASITFKSNNVDKLLLRKFYNIAKERIPVGFAQANEPYNKRISPECLILDYEGRIKELIDNFDDFFLPPMSAIFGELDTTKALLKKQIGTLGGGNHFIELQKNVEKSDEYQIMVHTGSRGAGKKCADFYSHNAKKEREMRGLSDKIPGVLFHSPENQYGEARSLAQSYLLDSEHLERYAFYNRLIILNECLLILKEVGIECRIHNALDFVHNKLDYYMDNIMVHRHGAIKLMSDGFRPKPIPGSMGTFSVLVHVHPDIMWMKSYEGIPTHFLSVSHGSGRRLGRGEAKRSLSLMGEIANLDTQGIVHGLDSVDGLDEAASSYKDLSNVLALQADLLDVDSIVQYKPLVSIKG